MSKNFLKGEKCCINRCEKTARGIIKKRSYCQRHFEIKNWRERKKRMRVVLNS